MKATFITAIAILLSSILHGQSHYFGASAVVNKYQSNCSFVNRKLGIGVALSFRFHDTGKIKIPIFRNFYSHLIAYQGQIYDVNTAAAGAFQTGCNLTLSRLNLGIGWMPVNLILSKTANRFVCNAGMELNFNLHSRASGTVFYTKKYDSAPPQGFFNYYQVNEKIEKNKQLQASPWIMGFSCNVSYCLNQYATSSIFISYQFYQGISAEVNPKVDIYSQRHQLGVFYAF